ncbi:Ig-like domain-containing protein [Patescibacteria group bacterium]|nr:Ig-like domain-containing protein [Patescibacteria group bacterium]
MAHPVRYLTKKATKQLLDLMKHEIFAVLAVALLCLVVVFIYNYQTTHPQFNRGTSPSTGGEDTPATGLWLPNWVNSGLNWDFSNPKSGLAFDSPILLASTKLGDVIIENLSILEFGSAIKGHNRDGVETWANEAEVRNQGNYLQIDQNNQVVIQQITNGNHNVWVKGKGVMTINGVPFNFRTLKVLNKVVGVTEGQFIIDFKAGAQIYSISTLSPNTDIPAATQASIPTKIVMLPSQATITLNSRGFANFKPVVILTDQVGKQIAGTANMLTWSSSNPAIATVDVNGFVTATKLGEVTIATNVTGTELNATTHLTVKSVELSPIIDITPPQNLETANK